MHFCRLSQYFDRKYKFVKKSASVIDIESHAAMSTNMYWYSNNAVNAHLKQTFCTGRTGVLGSCQPADMTRLSRAWVDICLRKCQYNLPQNKLLGSICQKLSVTQGAANISSIHPQFCWFVIGQLILNTSCQNNGISWLCKVLFYYIPCMLSNQRYRVTDTLGKTGSMHDPNFSKHLNKDFFHAKMTP